MVPPAPKSTSSGWAVMTRILMFYTVEGGKSFHVIHLVVILYFQSIHIVLFGCSHELCHCIYGLADNFSHLLNCSFDSCKSINYTAVTGFLANSRQIDGCRLDDVSSSDFPSLITAKTIDIAPKPMDAKARTAEKFSNPLKPIPTIAPIMNAKLYSMSYAAKTCPMFDFETFD